MSGTPTQLKFAKLIYGSWCVHFFIPLASAARRWSSLLRRIFVFLVDNSGRRLPRPGEPGSKKLRTRFCKLRTSAVSAAQAGPGRERDWGKAGTGKQLAPPLTYQACLFRYGPLPAECRIQVEYSQKVRGRCDSLWVTFPSHSDVVAFGRARSVRGNGREIKEEDFRRKGSHYLSWLLIQRKNCRWQLSGCPWCRVRYETAANKPVRSQFSHDAPRRTLLRIQLAKGGSLRLNPNAPDWTPPRWIRRELGEDADAPNEAPELGSSREHGEDPSAPNETTEERNSSSSSSNSSSRENGGDRDAPNGTLESRRSRELGKDPNAPNETPELCSTTERGGDSNAAKETPGPRIRGNLSLGEQELPWSGCHSCT